MNPDILATPWQTLLPLAAGYTGYFVSTVGLREHHRTIDVAFSTIVYAVLASWFYQLLSQVSVPEPGPTLLTFIFTVCVGAAWSRLGRRYLTKVLRDSDVTYSNDYPSAWAELFATTGVKVTQISVKLVDGTWLKCDRPARFEDEPNKSMILGYRGDLAIHVTHFMPPDESEFIPCDSVRDGSWGTELTYLPASQISRIDLRRKPITFSEG